MPNKPSWLLRVNDILADLSRPELTSLPFLSRAAIETLFGLKRRQAIQIMHAIGGFQIGKAASPLAREFGGRGFFSCQFNHSGCHAIDSFVAQPTEFQ